ncbi:MAG: transcriptional regulator [Bacteroidetes bacterium]|nr:MAG: transcriptional regulator [Bacteroidota bacterium]
MRLEDEIFQKKFKSGYHKAAINIIYTHNWLMGSHAALFKPFNVTSQQYNILRILRGQYPTPCSIKTIRERMLDKMSDASRIVEKLRLKGLVERKTCERDRRNVDVVITDKGLTLLDQIGPVENFSEKDLSALSPAEIDQLNNLLDKIRG